MQIREDIKIALLLVTAVATSVAAYATYKIYLDQTELPTLALKSYTIVGTEEVDFTDTSSLKLKKIESKGGVDTYELPLKVGNDSNKDVEAIQVLIDVEGGELIVPSDWSAGTYADNIRYYADIDHMSPKSSYKLLDVKIRIKNTTHEVRLKWSILAKRTIPPNGVLVFRF